MDLASSLTQSKVEQFRYNSTVLKNEAPNTTLQEMLEKLKIIHPKILCQSSNEVTHLCINHACSHNSFSCHNASCEACFTPHLICENIKLHAISHLLQKFTQSQNLFFVHLFEIEDNFIASLHRRRKELIDKYYWGSIQQQYREIINAVYFEQSQSYSLNGRLADQFFQSLKREVYDKKHFEEELLGEFSKQIEDIYTTLQQIKSKTIQMYNYSSLAETAVEPNTSTLSLDSQIILPNDFQSLQFIRESLWNPNKLLLLFRASQHQFEAAKFHQFCDNIENTFVLINTEYNKVIGGYTPIIWNKGNNAFAYETTNSSFLLSLNLKQKMKLVNTEKAIGCASNLGPLFGQYDIKISDRCNLLGQSCSSFPASYNSSPGYAKSQQTTSLFCGAISSNKFKVKEYEVYQVIWDS